MSRKSKKPIQEDEEKENESNPLPQYREDEHHTEPHNRMVLRIARDMYLKEYSFERIFLAVALPPSVFIRRRRAWDKLKARVDETLIEKIRAKAVSQQTKEFVEKGLQVGLKFINRLLKREDEIQAKDWKLVSDSIANLHRIHQLELGKPTDISMYEKMSPDQIREYLATMQKELVEAHDMSMFSPREDVPTEERLKAIVHESDTEIH